MEGVPHGGASVLMGEGGGVFEKNRRVGGAPPLWETLITTGVFIVSLSASTFHTLF